MLDYQECLKVDIQLDSNDQSIGEFGNRIAIDSLKLRVLQVGGCILRVPHQSCRNLLFESLASLVVLWM